MRTYNVTCTVVYTVELPCETVPEAVKFLNETPPHFSKVCLSYTNVSAESGFAAEDVEMIIGL